MTHEQRTLLNDLEQSVKSLRHTKHPDLRRIESDLVSFIAQMRNALHSPPPALQAETPEHAKHCPYRHSGASCTCGIGSLNNDVGYLNTSGKSLITPGTEDAMPDTVLDNVYSLRAENARLVEALAEKEKTVEYNRQLTGKLASKLGQCGLRIEQLEQQLAQSRTELEKLRTRAKRLETAGHPLAACAFNLSQQEVTLTDHTRDVLKKCQKDWDQALYD